MVINIVEESKVPKYLQIVNSFINKISSGELKIGEKIPSINELSEECYLSRDTVEKAYKKLKEKKIITSVKGKGFYVTRTELLAKINILFLVNRLSHYKTETYDSFVNTIGGNAYVSLSVYHCNEYLFLKELEKNMGAFDYYVIIPYFKDTEQEDDVLVKKIEKFLSEIPKDKLLILDHRLNLASDIPQIYQDFKNDIYSSLIRNKNLILPYKKFIMVYPKDAVYPYPKHVLQGWRQFCIEYSIEFEIIYKLTEDTILHRKELYLILDENDLITIFKKIKQNKFSLKEDIGIISYNDTPLKDLLDVTVVSTDFTQMGKTAAEFIINKQKNIQIKNPFSFINRNSI